MAFPDFAKTHSSKIVDIFGEDVLHHPKDGGAITTVQGVFDRAPFFADEIESGRSVLFTTDLSVKTTDAADWCENDTVTIRGVDYLVIYVNPDQYGVTQCQLKKQ